MPAPNAHRGALYDLNLHDANTPIMRDVSFLTKHAPWGAAASALLALVFSACSDGHDDLGVDSTSSSSSASTTGSGGTGGSVGTGGSEPIEPDGPPKLTLLGGVTDRDLSSFCFFSSGANTRPPFPSGGLGFGESATLAFPNDEIPVEGEILVASVIGTVGAGWTCDEIRGDPAGAGVEYVELGRLPAGTFEEKRSLLLATTGCLGGPGHEGEQQELACGVGYAPDSPTFSFVVVVLSRIVTPTRISLSTVHASAALPKVDVRVRPGVPEAFDIAIAAGVSLGALAPKPPFDVLDRTSLASIPDAGVVVYPAGGPMPMAEIKWSEALANGGLVVGDIENGRGYALVALGASPLLGAAAWWKPFTFAIVNVDGMP